MGVPLADQFSDIAKALAEIEAARKEAEAAKAPAEPIAEHTADECKPADCGHVADYGLGFCGFVCGRHWG